MSKINLDALNKVSGITLSRKNVNLSNFPDFLILGPQRTGSNWLYQNLKLHPQVFLTTPKEIFFFNKVKKPKDRKYKSNDLAWYLEFYDEPFEIYLKNNLEMLKKYGEFYRPKIRGEGTATYAAMSKDLIENVVILNPNIKAILMIRNPIMRAWSHAKKDLLNPSYLNNGRERTLEEVTDNEFEEFFLKSYKTGDYSTMIQNWSALLRRKTNGVYKLLNSIQETAPPEPALTGVPRSSCLKDGNLFIGFFDDIADCPQKLLLDIFDFLKISSKDKYITIKAKKRIKSTDKSKKRELPEKYKLILEELFKDEIMILEQKFGRRLIR